MIPLPFSEDPTDLLFLEVSERLKSQGIAFSDDKLYVIYRDVYGHVYHTTSLYGAFWKKLSDGDEIDVTKPEKSFYNVVLSRVQMSFETMSDETAGRVFFLLSVRMSKEMAMAMNHFFNEMIRELRADPVLAYASI